MSAYPFSGAFVKIFSVSFDKSDSPFGLDFLYMLDQQAPARHPLEKVRNVLRQGQQFFIKFVTLCLVENMNLPENIQIALCHQNRGFFPAVVTAEFCVI